MPENNAALHVGTMGDILPDSCQDKVVWHIVRGCAAPHSSYMSHHKPLPSFHERCCFPLTASGVHAGKSQLMFARQLCPFLFHLVDKEMPGQSLWVKHSTA